MGRVAGHFCRVAPRSSRAPVLVRIRARGEVALVPLQVELVLGIGRLRGLSVHGHALAGGCLEPHYQRLARTAARLERMVAVAGRQVHVGSAGCGGGSRYMPDVGKMVTCTGLASGLGLSLASSASLLGYAHRTSFHPSLPNSIAQAHAVARFTSRALNGELSIRYLLGTAFS